MPTVSVSPISFSHLLALICLYANSWSLSCYVAWSWKTLIFEPTSSIRSLPRQKAKHRKKTSSQSTVPRSWIWCWRIAKWRKCLLRWADKWLWLILVVVFSTILLHCHRGYGSLHWSISLCYLGSCDMIFFILVNRSFWGNWRTFWMILSGLLGRKLWMRGMFQCKSFLCQNTLSLCFEQDEMVSPLLRSTESC